MRLDPRRCPFCGGRFYVACVRCAGRALGHEPTARDLAHPQAALRLSLEHLAGVPNRN